MNPVIKLVIGAALGAVLIDLKTYYIARTNTPPGDPKPAFQWTEFGLKLALAVGGAAAAYFGLPGAQ
jgi:hypothetical protein